MRKKQEIKSVRTQLTLSALLFIAMNSHAYVGPQPPEPDCLWFTLLPQSPIASMSEYDQACRSFIPKMLVGKPVQPMLVEFRSYEDQQVIARIPYDHFGRAVYPIGLSKSSEYVKNIRAKLKDLPDGNYLVAFTIDGKRCSNVAEFSLVTNTVINDLPVLETVALEPAPFSALPFLGLRVTGSDALKETFKASDAVYGKVTVDGVERRSTIQVWGGGNPELKSGQQWLHILDLSGFREPIITPGVDHVVKFAVDTYAAAPIDFNPTQHLGEAWDAATKKE
jgi:hypothetical protein